MVRQRSFLVIWLIALTALLTLVLFLTSPSWSSPDLFFVTNPPPRDLPLTAGTQLTLSGGGFSPTTDLWLIPEPSIRSSVTAILETYGSPQQFVRRDDFLYVANGTGGFFIVQGLQQPVPTITGVLKTNGQGMEVVLRRDEALMAAGANGLQIIDIRDKGNPQLLAELKDVAPAISVAACGTIAYIASGRDGLQIVDLADLRHPRRLGKLANLPEAYRVICDEELLIIATATGGAIYDVSQPAQPHRLAELPVGRGTNTVMLRQGKTLYWASKNLEENRLYVMDLSRTSAPQLVSIFPLMSSPMGISCSDGILAIALGSYGTQLFSLQGEDSLLSLPPIAPTFVTRFSLVTGNEIWVADGRGTLRRLDRQLAATLTFPPLLPDFTSRIPPIVIPKLLFLGDETGLAIYGHGEEQAPVLLARLEIDHLTQLYLATDQRHLWLVAHSGPPPATSGKVIAVDITDPSLPRITSEISLPHAPAIVGEFRSTLVLASDTKHQALGADPFFDAIPLRNTLYFLDISRPERPLLVLTSLLPRPSIGMGLSDSWLLLMEQGGNLKILDLAAKGEPRVIGSLSMPWLHSSAWSSAAVHMIVKNKVAYLSSPLGEIAVIDLHDPGQPKKLGSLNLDGPVVSLCLSDRLLFAEGNQVGLTVIDLQNRFAPEILGTIPLPGIKHSLTVQGGRFWFVTLNLKGLQSFPLPQHLQNSVVGSHRLSAEIDTDPPAGAYAFWLTDKGKNLLLPGVNRSRGEIPGR